jgi:hypothetical protein
LFSTGGVLSQNAYDFNGSDQLSDELIFDLSKRAYAPVAYRNVDFAADATGAPLNKHYKLFSDLPIGDPFCCEVSRSVNNSPAADVMTALHQENGFVFVGGAGGLAVLSRNDGTGFDSSVGSAGGLGSDIEDFTADPQSFGDATFAFRKIPGIEESVHDLVSTGRYLYVMTPKNLYRIRLHAEKGLTGAAEMFDTAELNAAPTMFSSAMSHVDATSVASLEVLTGGEQTTFAGKVTTAHFSKGQVVIQKVMTLGDDEHFAQMIGVPNSQVIFVATNSAKTISHKIYVIKEGDNPALTTIKTAIATADNKITGSNESFRRMHLAMCNTFNQNLTQGDGAALTLTSGVTIANLYVLTGSVFSPSKLLRYEIVGGVEAADVDVPGSHYRYPRVGLAAATAWHSAATTVSSTGFLANGMTTDSGPMLFASSNASGAGTEGHLWRFDPAATNSMRALESGSATKSEYRALFPTATGSQQFFGSFGVVGQE